MGENSKIQWTDHTFNPWWGCTKVSAGCANCYAEGISKRFGDYWGPLGTRRHMSDHTWEGPERWNRAAGLSKKRARVFCASMADVFEGRDDLISARQRLFNLIDRTSNLDWLLLTKRPENIVRVIPTSWKVNPRKNVWYGVSIEDEQSAAKRLPYLLTIPAAMRFISIEPILGRIDILPWFNLGTIDWVITGGESGPRARPADPEWFRLIRNACTVNNVPYFHKQNGGKGKDHGGELLDGKVWHEFPNPMWRK